MITLQMIKAAIREADIPMQPTLDYIGHMTNVMDCAVLDGLHAHEMGQYVYCRMMFQLVCGIRNRIAYARAMMGE